MANCVFVGECLRSPGGFSVLIKAYSSDIESFFIPSVDDIVKIVQNQTYALEGTKTTVRVNHLECIEVFVDMRIDRLFGWWLCVQ